VARYVLNPDGKAVKLGSKVTVQLQPGDVMRIQSCGGGGYSLPEERDPQLVLRDVREGKVSLERAREIYFVEIDPNTWTVAEAETAKLRGEDVTKQEPDATNLMRDA
jgi:N-methylhydantoinase B